MAVHRTAPKCPKCGEDISGKHWQPETFFCGDTFTGWDWANHRCRLGIKYFIERTDTHQWWWEDQTDNYNERSCGWTNNPQDAVMFDTNELAESYLKESSAIPSRVECIVTEHEFVTSAGEKI